MCDETRLGIPVRYCAPVRLAAQHAHQRGVIHHDRAPSSVFVTERDGEPLRKVIDFGIAEFDNDGCGRIGRPS